MKKNKFGILILISLLFFGIAFCVYKFVYKHISNNLIYTARITNVKFVQDGETYKFSYSTLDKMNLTTEKNYEVYIKNEKCKTNYYSENLLNCTLEHIFKNNVGEEIKDEININFEESENKTSVSFELKNADTVSEWESYLSKFIIRVKTTESSEDMKTVSIIAGENTTTLKVRTGYTIELPATIEIDDTFLGWEYNGQIITSLTVAEDSKIIAKTETMYTVFIYRNAPNKRDNNSDRIGSISLPKNSQVVLETPTCDNFKFLGWSLDKQTLLDLETYKLNSDIEIYAMWDTTLNPIKIEFNESEASIDFNGKTITGNQTVYVDFTDKITITNPTKEGYALYYIEIIGAYERMTYSASELEELNTYEFYYKNLNSNSEYDPSGSTESVGPITIRLTFVSTTDEVLEAENKIYKKLGIKSQELTKQEDEQTFLKTLYFGLTRDEKTYTVQEYRQKLANKFSFEYDENCSFEEYLTVFIEKVLFEYTINLIVDDTTTETVSVLGSKPIYLTKQSKDGYTFAGWKIEGMTNEYKKYYSYDLNNDFTEIPAEQTSITLTANSFVYLKDLARNGGIVNITVLWSKTSSDTGYRGGR